MTDQPTPDAACRHKDFAASVAVQRLEDIGRFVAEVQVCCAQCGLAFSFLGLPHAITVERPSVSIDATTASLPIEPGAKPIPLRGTIPVEMPRRSES